MLEEKIEILSNAKVNGKYYKLIFQSKKLSAKVLPGQFLQVQIDETLDPFLRRPFSYYKVKADKVEILYEVLGRGTGILSQKRKGEALSIIGPLGKSFTQKVKAKKRVLVAGGVGVPPLLFLAAREKIDYILIGAKSKAEVMPKSELANVSGKILYATNDGSYGRKGFVTVLLEEIIKEVGAENLFVQTCGPTPMMKAVFDIAKREKISGEASIDKPMACGVGACLGCMVLTPKGWVPSCVEGPVFPFDQIAEW